MLLVLPLFLDCASPLALLNVDHVSGGGECETAVEEP